MGVVITRVPAAAALAGLLLVGCGDAATACAYAVCAIEEPSCVAQVAAVLACRLGQDVVVPEVRLLTAEAYLAEAEAEAAPPTAEEQRDEDDWYRAQALVGLMPEGYAPTAAGADFVRNFAAFYSPDDKRIVLLTDRPYGSPRGEYLVLVHEVVHAYQDAMWDLGALLAEHGTSHDRGLGVRAFVEGNAVLHQNFASLELDRASPDDVDWDAYFDEWQAESLEEAFASETPALDESAHFPYAFGGEFVHDAWEDGTNERIDELAARPPDSVRQVMQGFAAWPDRADNEDEAFDPMAVAVLPGQYAPITGGHEGVWLINAMLQRTAGGGPWAAGLAEVSADFLTAWRRDDAEVVAVWRIRSAQPEALAAALTGPGARWQDAGVDAPTTHLVTRSDADVLLIAVSAGDARTVLADITGWTSPTEAFAADPNGALRTPRAVDRLRLRRPGRARSLPLRGGSRTGLDER